MRTVYIHTTPDGKRYVGATHMNPDKRFKNGLGYRYQFFYQAILKFGWENISHQLYEVDTEEELKYLEKYLIAYYDTTNPDKGYNITKGDKTQDQGRDHPEYGNGGGYSRYKENFRKYQTSEKGKEHHRLGNKKYYHTEKGKEAQKRFKNSAKGKESIKLSTKKYDTSEKGKEARRRAYQRYLATEKGKEASRRAMKRYLEKKKKQMKNE